MGLKSVKKYMDCATTFEMCIFPDNYKFVLDYQTKMKVDKKRANLPEVMNAIIKKLKDESNNSK